MPWQRFAAAVILNTLPWGTEVNRIEVNRQVKSNGLYLLCTYLLLEGEVDTGHKGLMPGVTCCESGVYRRTSRNCSSNWIDLIMQMSDKSTDLEID